MTTVALAAASLAALVHVYIFVLESFRWEDPRTRAVFGLGREQAAATRELAYNQGFYNLFLALAAGLGVALWGVDRTVATTLIVVGCGSMLAASLVLVTSDRSKARPAAIQGVLPAIAVAATIAVALA